MSNPQILEVVSSASEAFRQAVDLTSCSDRTNPAADITERIEQSFARFDNALDALVENHDEIRDGPLAGVIGTAEMKVHMAAREQIISLQELELARRKRRIEDLEWLRDYLQSIVKTGREQLRCAHQIERALKEDIDRWRSECVRLRLEVERDAAEVDNE